MQRLRPRLKRASLLIITLVVATFSSGGLASADGVCPTGMSNLDCQSLVDNWVNWVPDMGSCSAGTDSGTTAGSDQSQAQQIAQTFIIGFDASTPKAAITDLATKYHIGGMYVLGTKNAAAAGFDKAFYNSLDQAAGSPLIESSDEEGIITRYSYPSGSFPSAAAMAKQSNDAVAGIGKKAGAVMTSNGLSADLAPVLDLRDVGIGGRSFSSDPDVVAQKAGAFTDGLTASGIAPIFKHFPGFDSTTSGNTDLEKVEMKGSIDKTVAPYKTLLKKYPDAGVMLSNMYVDKFDANNPASLSAAAVSYLRQDMNFKGMITTDDLSVSSVTNKAGSLADAVAQALQAGVTMPLFTLKASSTQVAETNLDKIIAAVQSNSAAMSKLPSGKGAIESFKGLSGASNGSANGSVANCCGSSTTVLAGGDNETKAWNYFKGQGLDDSHVAAIMGNIQQESSFNPEIIQNGGTTKDPSTVTSGGWGIVQWTPGKKVLGIAQKLGIKTPIYDLATQLNIVWGEMNGTTPAGDSSFMSGFKAAKTLADQTSYFTVHYEAAGIVGPRLKNAQDALSHFAGTGGGSSSASSGGCISSVDCSSATGVGKILCAAKNYNSVSYQESTIGGHQGAANWHKSCPTIGPSCYLDCSGLVNIAVYDVFHVDINENTDSERADEGKYWKVISFKDLQPGDLIQPGEYNGGHVEIVDHLVGNKIYTFGAHSSHLPQPQQVGPSAYANTSGNLYLHYMGPGV